MWIPGLIAGPAIIAVAVKPVLELEADLFPRKKSRKNRDPAAEGGDIKASEWEMVFMGNIIMDVHENPDADKEGAPPPLIRAASLSTPNKRIGEHTIALVDSLLDRGYDFTRLVFDREYSQLTTEQFHQPLADRNIDVVKDYKGGKHASQLGISNGVGGAPSLTTGSSAPAHRSTCSRPERTSTKEPSLKSSTGRNLLSAKTTNCTCTTARKTVRRCGSPAPRWDRRRRLTALCGNCMPRRSRPRKRTDPESTSGTCRSSRPRIESAARAPSR